MFCRVLNARSRHVNVILKAMGSHLGFLKSGTEKVRVLRKYVYIYIYIYICICIRICIHTYTYTHIHTHTYIHIHIRTYIPQQAA